MPMHSSLNLGDTAFVQNQSGNNHCEWNNLATWSSGLEHTIIGDDGHEFGSHRDYVVVHLEKIPYGNFTGRLHC